VCVLPYYYWYITEVRLSVILLVKPVFTKGIPAVVALQVYGAVISCFPRFGTV
jgi:hypothetical protein